MCGYYVSAATIQRQRLFEEIRYSCKSPSVVDYLACQPAVSRGGGHMEVDGEKEREECVVTGGGRSGGVAGGGMCDVSGGMVVREGGDWY